MGTPPESGTGPQAKSDKLQALWADRPMPEQWALTPLNDGEPRLAKRFVGRLNGAGDVLADANYDSNAKSAQRQNASAA